MARGINKVILIGNLGADPETRYMPSGNAVSNITLATSDSWRDRETGQQRERTEWHRVVFFGKLAEIVGQYLRKGSKVYIEGRLQTREWEKDGIKRYTTEVVVDMGGQMQMLDSRGGGDRSDQSQQAYQQESYQQQAAPAPAPAPAPAQQQARPAPAATPPPPQQQPPAADFDSDDIPF